MKFEIEINGVKLSFTKWLRIIVVFVFLGFIARDVFQKDWNALSLDLLWLIVVIQGNEITDLQDEIEDLKERVWINETLSETKELKGE